MEQDTILKSLIRKIEDGGMVHEDSLWTDAGLLVRFRQAPQDVSQIADILGLAVEASYPVPQDDPDSCVNFAVLADPENRLVAAVRCFGDGGQWRGHLAATVCDSESGFDRKVREEDRIAWLDALHRSVRGVSGLLRRSPLGTHDTVRFLLKETLPQDMEEYIRFLGAAGKVINEFERKAIGKWLQIHAPKLARIEWQEESAYDDAGGFYTYLSSITLVTSDGERFVMTGDDASCCSRDCEQYEQMKAGGVAEGEDPDEAFTARLSRRLGYEGDFWLLWDHVLTLVGALRNSGEHGFDLRDAKQA